MLRQEYHAIETLRIGAAAGRRGHPGIGRGNGAASSEPVGYGEICGELNLIGAADQRQPPQTQTAACLCRLQNLRRHGFGHSQPKDCTGSVADTTASFESCAIEATVSSLDQACSRIVGVRAIESKQGGQLALRSHLEQRAEAVWVMASTRQNQETASVSCAIESAIGAFKQRRCRESTIGVIKQNQIGHGPIRSKLEDRA